MKYNDLLLVSMKIGSLMLSYGAEIYRVEESISRICKAYGAKDVNIFAITSNLIVTIYYENNSSITLTKNVAEEEIDLDKVDRLNNLSRFICYNKPDINTINNLIIEILNRKSYSKFLITLSYAIAPATFCLFFGGNVIDALLSMPIGIIIYFVLKNLRKINTNLLFENILCSSIASIISVGFFHLGITKNYDKIIIGSIMLLVPGLLLTNSIRDLMMGDIIAGILKIVEAVLVATGIAIGVALILSLSNIL